jgi:hypothetical protein
MNRLIGLAAIINDLTEDELATISRDESLDALMVAMCEYAGHPEIDAALERLSGINLGKETTRFGQRGLRHGSLLH